MNKVDSASIEKVRNIADAEIAARRRTKSEPEFDMKRVEEINEMARRHLDSQAMLDAPPDDVPPLSAYDEPRARVTKHPEPASTEDPFSSWPDGRIGHCFSATPPPTAWFCEKRLLMGRAHLLSGVGGSGKTRFLFQLGIGAVVGALAWDWQVSASGSTVLFLKEDTPAQVHRTLHALGRNLNPEHRALLDDRMRVFPLAGHPALMLQMLGGVLTETDVLEWMLDRIREAPQPVVFVGIDPAIGFTDGDEMSQSHQRRLGELVDKIAIQTGACVVLSSHASKGSLSHEELTSHTSRGGGAITDAVRAEFVIRGMNANEAQRHGIGDFAERKRHVQVAATKGNELPPEAYAPMWLRHDDAGLALAELDGSTVARPLSPRERSAYEVLVEANKGGQTTLKFWREQCLAKGIITKKENGDSHEKAMNRIRERLVTAGKVGPGDLKGLWIPLEGDNE